MSKEFWSPAGEREKADAGGNVNRDEGNDARPGHGSLPGKAATSFLQGDGKLTSTALVGLHERIPDKKLVAQMIAARKGGSKLGASVGKPGSLKGVLASGKFDWGRGMGAPKKDPTDKAGADTGGNTDSKLGYDKKTAKDSSKGDKAGVDRKDQMAPPAGNAKGAVAAKADGAAAPSAKQGPAPAPSPGGKGGPAPSAGPSPTSAAPLSKGDAPAATAKAGPTGKGDGEGKGGGPSVGGKGDVSKGDLDAKGPQGDGQREGDDDGADVLAASGDEAIGVDDLATVGKHAGKGGPTDDPNALDPQAAHSKLQGGKSDHPGAAASHGKTGATGKSDTDADHDTKGDPAGAQAHKNDDAHAHGDPDGKQSAGKAAFDGAMARAEGGAKGDSKGAHAKGHAVAAKGKADPGKGAPGALGKPQVNKTPAPSTAKTAGGSAGGGTTAAAAPKPAVSTRAPDGLVDHYMETHWDSKVFYQKVAEIGHMPNNVGTELDHWLPPDMSPGTRGALNLACSVAGGVIDAVVMGIAKALPGVGLPFILLDGIKGMLDVDKKYGKEGVNDPEGERLAMFRAGIDLTGSITSNLADLCSLVEDVCHAVAPFSAGASELIGVPATAIGEVLRGISLGCDFSKVILDGVLFFHDKQKANEAEARGDFATAGKYRDLMFGDVVNGVKDTISLVMNAIGAFSANTVGGGGAAAQGAKSVEDAVVKGLGKAAKIDSLEAATKGYRTKAAGGVVGGMKNDGVKSGGANSEGVGTIIANLKARVGLGDPMAANPDALFGEQFIQRNGTVAGGGTPEHDLLQGARAATIARMDGDYHALVEHPPEWTQKIINDIAKPPEGPTVSDALDVSPSNQLKHLFSGIRNGMAMLGDGSLDSIAAGADKIAGFLQTFIAPAMDHINEFIHKEKPAIEQVLDKWNESLQKQDFNLKKLDDLIKGAQSTNEQIAKLAEKGSWMDAEGDKLISVIGKLRVDRNKLHIPAAVPDFVVNPVLNRFNALVTRLENEARKLKADALSKLNENIKAATQFVAGKIAEFQKMFGEGSEFRQALQAQFDQLKHLFDQGVQMFKQWDATIKIDITGAGAWLKEVAKRARTQTQHAKEDRWKSEVLPMAQASVDKWRADHGKQVESQFYPQVPSGEVSACNTVKSMLSQKLQPFLASQNPADRQEAQAAMQRLNEAMAGVRGGQGKEALLSLWAAEDQLAVVATMSIFRRKPAPAIPGIGGDPGDTDTNTDPTKNKNQAPPSAVA